MNVKLKRKIVKYIWLLVILFTLGNVVYKGIYLGNKYVYFINQNGDECAWRPGNVDLVMCDNPNSVQGYVMEISNDLRYELYAEWKENTL